MNVYLQNLYFLLKNMILLSNMTNYIIHILISSTKQLQNIYYCFLYHFLKFFPTFSSILINICPADILCQNIH